METHLAVLIVHIACGFTALTVGIAPMVAQKGGRLHRGAGKIYVWAMYGVSATTVALFLLHPQRPFLQFLLGIAVLAFYFTFTGVRAIALKRRQLKSLFADRLIAWLTLCVSASMFVYGAYAVVFALQHHTGTFLGILYLIFGPTLGSAAFADVKYFSLKKPAVKRHWFFQHFIRMLSAYIATFTAFCVVNVHFLPPLLVWTLPGIIGVTLISRVVKKYRGEVRKSESPKKSESSRNRIGLRFPALSGCYNNCSFFRSFLLSPVG